MVNQKEVIMEIKSRMQLTLYSYCIFFSFLFLFLIIFFGTFPVYGGIEERYIFPDSDKSYLTANDTDGLSKLILNYGRNEIYARHGKIFQFRELNSYFQSKSWYHGTITAADFDNGILNEYEKSNISYLENLEKKDGSQGYTFGSQKDPMNEIHQYLIHKYPEEYSILNDDLEIPEDQKEELLELFEAIDHIGWYENDLKLYYYPAFALMDFDRDGTVELIVEDQRSEYLYDVYKYNDQKGLLLIGSLQTDSKGLFYSDNWKSLVCCYDSGHEQWEYLYTLLDDWMQKTQSFCHLTDSAEEMNADGTYNYHHEYFHYIGMKKDSISEEDWSDFIDSLKEIEFCPWEDALEIITGEAVEKNAELAIAPIS